MDKEFDLNALLTFHSNLHKVKPQQFTNVAKGVKKRLETNINRRRSSRFSVFDKLRNLPNDSPAKKLSKEEKLKLKTEQKFMQLEKWKQERDKKKREAAALKKKPFLVGTVRPAPKLEELPKVMPSTSGRVTRSQTRQVIAAKSQTANKKSFAPENATFCPPLIKNMKALPVLFLPSCNNRHDTAELKLEANLKKTNKTNQVKVKKIKKSCKTNGVEVNKRTKVSQNGEKSELTKQEKHKERSCPVQNPNSDQLDSSKPKTINIKKQIPKENISTNKKQSSKKSKDVVKKANSSSRLSRNLSVITLESDSTSEVTKKPNPCKKLQQKREKLSIKSVTINSSEDSSPVVEKNTRKSMQGKGSARKKDSNLIKKNYVRISNTIIDSTDSIADEVINTSKKSSLCGSDNQSEKTPLKSLPNSESSFEEKYRSPKDAPMTPEQLSQLTNCTSPCITMSRGKDNARREMKQKLKEGLLGKHIESMDSVDHFHHQLNMETNRLTEMADHWERIMEQNVLPDFVQEAILAAVGQARLLMSQKFQQFASLVERCDAADPTQPLVTPVDLQGFWEMVYMQVENLNVRFKKLEEMQSRGWAPEQEVVVEKKRRAPAAKTAKPVTTSRIKDMIAAARKAKKEQETAPPEGSKTFEAGFFSVKSPVRSPPLTTPNKPVTLLKAVLSNEATKASKSSTSFAMVRASLIGKNHDSDYSSMDIIQRSPVDLNATPGRSILKSTAKDNRKSVKTVLFDSSDATIDLSLDRDISGVQRLESAESTNSEPENQDVERVSTEEEIPEHKELEQLPLEKENVDVEKSSRKVKKGTKYLVRQNAVEEFRPAKTRSRRKTVTPNKVILQESNNTPRRSTRRQTIAANNS